MENKNKKLRAAAYVRVSTDEQAKDGYGLIFQEEKIKSFVVSQDYVLEEKHIYRDEGRSGTLPIESRSELKRLFDDAAKKEFDVVLVYRLDRFFRKTRLLLDALDRLSNSGVGFRSTTESFDTTNITGRFMTTMLGAVAEMERDTIKERMMSGRVVAARSGKWVMGSAPFGYEIDKKTKTLKIAPEEAKWVKEFFKWLVEENLSLHKIAKRANELKILTKGVRLNRKILGKKTTGYWHKRTLGRILTNDVYAGVATFRKYAKRPKGVADVIVAKNLRPQEEWIDIVVPTIVSLETIEAARRQLWKNREMSERNAKQIYLYGKLIYCGYCGYKMPGAFNPPAKDGYVMSKYYRGVFRQKEWLSGSKRCAKCGNYAETRLEPVWEVLKQILQTPKNIYGQLEKLGAKRIDREVMKEKLGQVEKQLVSIEKKKRKLLDLYLDEETADNRPYKIRLKEYEQDEKDLRKESIRIKQILLNKQDRIEQKRALVKLADKFRNKLDTDKVSYEEKAQLIHRFIGQVILYAKQNVADVMYEFPKKEYVEAFSVPLYANTQALEPKYLYSERNYLKPELCLRDELGRYSAKMD